VKSDRWRRHRKLRDGLIGVERCCVKIKKDCEIPLGEFDLTFYFSSQDAVGCNYQMLKVRFVRDLRTLRSPLIPWVEIGESEGRIGALVGV
jgi:hypothetical protein